MKGVNFVWFSYELDQKLLDVSLTYAKWRWPEARFFIFEQWDRPISYDVKAMHRDERTIFEKTWWNRCYNLNGWEAIRGMLGNFMDVSRAFPTDWVCKIDSDTLLLNNRHLAPKLYKQSSKAVSFFLENWKHLIGSCYFLRKDILEDLYKFSVNKTDTLADSIDCYGEDWTISHMIQALYGRESIDFVRNNPKSFIKSFAYWKYGASMADILKHYDMVCFGEKKSIPSDDPRPYRHITMFDMAVRCGVPMDSFTYNPSPPEALYA